MAVRPSLYQVATMAPLALVVLPLAVTATDADPVASRPARLEVATDPRFRAIFCGKDGTETSAEYAQALNRDLGRLGATAGTIAQALRLIRDRACGGADASR